MKEGAYMTHKVNDMSEEELQKELEKIRGERAGRGRVRKKKAKADRIVKVQKEVRTKKRLAEEGEAEWV